MALVFLNSWNGCLGEHGHLMYSNFYLPLSKYYRSLKLECKLVLFSILFSPTKAAIAASIIFVIDKKTDWISVPHSTVYLGVVSFFVYFKISSLLINLHDPFIPFENLFCQLFMGGIWDALAHVIGRNGKLIILNWQ